MKKYFFLVIVLFISLKGITCSICGCGGGNLYMGLVPDFKNKFIGVRYQYAQFHTQLANDPTQFSKNYYNTVELWSGYNVSPSFRIMAFVPYYFNKQIDDDGTMKKDGIGDVTILVQYNIWKSSQMLGNQKMLNQKLWIGGGVKLPTGSFKLTDTTVADINAQLGTASTDFILSGQYSLNVSNFGLNASANYKLNMENKDKYQYGNKFTGNLLAFYKKGINGCYLIPNTGIGFEKTEKNKLNNDKVTYTGSQLTNYIAGLEVNYDDIAFGMNVQIPIQQNFAEGQTKNNVKAMAHLAYSF